MKPRNKKASRQRSTAFVPGVVFATTFASVVPACSGSQRQDNYTVAAPAFGTAGTSTTNEGDAATAGQQPFGEPSPDVDGGPAMRSETIVLAYVAFDSGARDAAEDASAEPASNAGDAAPAADADAGHARGHGHATRPRH